MEREREVGASGRELSPIPELSLSPAACGAPVLGGFRARVGEAVADGISCW